MPMIWSASFLVDVLLGTQGSAVLSMFKSELKAQEQSMSHFRLLEMRKEHLFTIRVLIINTSVYNRNISFFHVVGVLIDN